VTPNFELVIVQYLGQKDKDTTPNFYRVMVHPCDESAVIDLYLALVMTMRITFVFYNYVYLYHIKFQDMRLLFDSNVFVDNHGNTLCVKTTDFTRRSAITPLGSVLFCTLSSVCIVCRRL